MKPRVTLITLGVDDFDRAVKFYAEGMGLKTEGIVGREFARCRRILRTPGWPEAGAVAP